MPEGTVKKPLQLKIKGRVIDHLGIQMYQSPVAALAELVSNSWDADAKEVSISLPATLADGAEIVVRDDGHGMTYEECNNFYLEVGRARRGDDPEEKSKGGRPVLGRKGIGKFAGFGIAQIICVETTSEETGEYTYFELDIDKIRTASYVEEGDDTVSNVKSEGPAEERKKEHGTTITLKKLIVSRVISPDPFARSMARRFTIASTADNFAVKINGLAIPETADLAKIEFSFPKDYDAAEKPPELVVLDDGWGTEPLPDGHVIEWKIDFYEDPIDEEELRGVAVFAKGKLAQTPFFFNLSGGLGGQHGQQYLSGRVRADFVDSLPTDLIAPERQRINWQLRECAYLLEWGQERVKQLLKLWKERRSREKIALIETKLSVFKSRIDKLPKSEAEIIKRALRKLAGVSTLGNPEFISLSEAILTAWEGGRLSGLIHRLAQPGELSEKELLETLIELNVITALHTLEAVKAKLGVVEQLGERIANQELENAVRDYIGENPWLVDPKWETFVVERSVEHLVKDAGVKAQFDKDPDFGGRVDLVLSSGETLLIMEFMRPGLKLDYDHLDRYERYIRNLRAALKTQSGIQFRKVVGYLVADKMDRQPDIVDKLHDLEEKGMYALTWESLLGVAASKWRDFMFVLAARAPNDPRIVQLLPPIAAAPRSTAIPIKP